MAEDTNFFFVEDEHGFLFADLEDEDEDEDEEGMPQSSAFNSLAIKSLTA